MACSWSFWACSRAVSATATDPRKQLRQLRLAWRRFSSAWVSAPPPGSEPARPGPGRLVALLCRQQVIDSRSSRSLVICPARTFLHLAIVDLVPVVLVLTVARLLGDDVAVLHYRQVRLAFLRLVSAEVTDARAEARSFVVEILVVLRLACAIDANLRGITVWPAVISQSIIISSATTSTAVSSSMTRSDRSTSTPVISTPSGTMAAATILTLPFRGSRSDHDPRLIPCSILDGYLLSAESPCVTPVIRTRAITTPTEASPTSEGTVRVDRAVSNPVTRRVPAQYASIQSAIDDAWHGDTIRVAPGFTRNSFILTGNESRSFQTPERNRPSSGTLRL